MVAAQVSRDLSAVEIAKLEGRVSQGFAEMSGKLDTLIAKQEAAESRRDEDRSTHDGRLTDHENRLRVVEARRTVSPLGLWSVVLGAIGALAGLAAAFNALT